MHFRPTKMSLELLTDAHVSMCRIDVQTSRSRDKGKVQKAKTLFALSPILFVLPKKLSTGSHFQCGRLFLPPKFSQLSPQFKELNRTFCLSLFWTVFYYKCLFGSTDINVLEHTSFISHGRTRKSNSFNLQTPLCRTSTFNWSFLF